jgi:hypothetical protein|tara:strand:- start:567 stop:791 length:225 start_codon:yes stop_codon:yes gene_type:complete
MQMEYKSSKELANETIIYAGEMEPMDRNEFIDLICDQYQVLKHSQSGRGVPRYPQREVKKFATLLSKLVKKFGN